MAQASWCKKHHQRPNVSKIAVVVVGLVVVAVVAVVVVVIVFVFFLCVVKCRKKVPEKVC